MKKLIMLPTFAILLVIAGCITGKHIKSSGVIDIIDVRKTQEPGDNLANHKQKDIAAYKTTSEKGGNYKVSLYRKEKNHLNVIALRCYSAYYGADDDMDKAAYKWLNDTLVSFRLYNSSSKKEITFKVSGKGGTTRLIFDN